jgi:DNA topoisomerase-1
VLEHFSLGELSRLPKPRLRKGLKAEEVALAMFLEQLAEDLPKKANAG